MGKEKTSVFGVGEMEEVIVCFVIGLGWIHGVILALHVGDEATSHVPIVQGEVMLIAHNVVVEVMRIAIIVITLDIPNVVYALEKVAWPARYVMEMVLLPRAVMNARVRAKYIRFASSVTARGVLENHFDIL